MNGERAALKVVAFGRQAAGAAPFGFFVGVDDPRQDLLGVGGHGHLGGLGVGSIGKRRVFPTLFFEELDHLGDLLLADRGELKGQLRSMQGGDVGAALADRDKPQVSL